MRRLVTAVVVAAMMVVSGCGRQVTGLDLPSGAILPPGQTQVRFFTAGPLDLQNLTYLIVFNTTGNGQQPFAQGFNSDFKNWSAFFIVGGGANFANAPGLFQVFQNQASGQPDKFPINYPVGTVTFSPTIPNANVQFGFQITFNTCLLDLTPPSGTQTILPNLRNPCPPFSAVATNWSISPFTVDRSGSAVDSLGLTGPDDTSYRFAVEMANVQDVNSLKPAGGTTVQNRSAQITGIEVLTTPGAGAVPAPSPTPKP